MAVASLCFLFFYPWFRHEVDFRSGDLKWILLMAFCEPCLYFVFEAGRSSTHPLPRPA